MGTKEGWLGLLSNIPGDKRNVTVMKTQPLPRIIYRTTFASSIRLLPDMA